jgi:hypothetical protein
MTNNYEQQNYCKRYQLNISTVGMNLDSSNMDVDFKYEKVSRDGLRYLKDTKYEIIKKLHTFKVSDTDSKTIIDQLPSNVLDLEIPYVQYLELTPRETNSTQTLPPHIDPHRFCSLNLYMEASGEDTYFFEKNGLKLVEAAKFTAVKGEVWVLNTSKLHSVTTNSNKTRKVVTLSFSKIKYNQLVDALDNCT